MLHAVRFPIAFVLSLSLLVSPILALPVTRTNFLLPIPKPLPVPVIKAAYRASEVLVKFRDTAPETMREQVRSNYGSDFAQRVAGDSQMERLQLKPGLDVAQALTELQQLHALVEWVEPNYLVKTEAATRRGSDTGTRSKNKRLVAASAQTSPIVAVIDTGIAATHPNLRRRLAEGWNVMTDTANISDDNGHGTQMAGIISQVNPNARLLPLKALDADGVGTISAVVAAMDRAVAQHAQVILYSFGTDGESKALREAIQRAEKAGVVVVTAAGNDGQDLAKSPQYPAAFNEQNLLTVAAVNAEQQLADFSNYGTAAQVAAPGVNVRTTNRPNAFTTISGTSASAAYVAGVASRLKAVRMWVSASTVKQSIIQGARKLPALEGKVSAGLVQVKGALEALQKPKLAAAQDEPKKEKVPPNKKLEERKTKFKERKAKDKLPDIEMPKSFPYDLGITRGNRPNLPESQVRINARQGAGYDDPVPTSTANFASYFSELTKANNDTGIAGSKPMQQVDPTIGVSAIGGFSLNLLSKNLNFTAPVLSLAGRTGLNLSLGLTYNSNVWTKNPGTSKMFYNAERGFPAPGWRLGFGAIQGINSSGNIGPYTNTITGKASFLYIQPDGTKRDLAYNTTTSKYESYDSSYLDFDATTKILRTTNGTQITFGTSATASGDYQFLPTQIKDRNGNFITIVYKQLSNNDTVMDYVIDTLGRRIDFFYQNNRLTEIRQDRNGTLFKYAIIDYTPVTLVTSFSGVTVDVSGYTVYVPSRITYPTGVNLRFYYTSYGQVHLVEKWVPTISGQGSERRVAFSKFGLYSVDGVSYPANSTWSNLSSLVVNDSSPAFSNRFEAAENWMGGAVGNSSLSTSFTYGYSTGDYYCQNCPTATVTEPTLAGTTSQTVHTFRNKPDLTQTYSVTGPGYDQWGYPTTMQFKNITTTYTSDSGVSYLSNLRPITSTITDQSNQSRKVGLSYLQQDGMWLVQHKDDYAANGTTVYRRTTMSYTSYPSQRILGLPLTTSVFAGPGTTLMAKSENVYDETASWQDSNNQPINFFINAGATVQHDDTNYGSGFIARGNLTSVKQYATDGTTNRVTARSSYDTNGNIRHIGDAAGNRQSIDLTDNFINKPAGLGALQAYPYFTSNPIGMKSGAQYNYYTGQAIKTFAMRPNQSAEEQVTTTTYDFADRPLRTTSPTGSYVELGYWDNILRQTTYTKRDVISGVDQLVYSWQDFTGAGMVLRKGSDHPNGGAGKFSGQKFNYDNLGRGFQQSNVLAITSSFAIDTSEPGQFSYTQWSWTDVEFDGLGRTTSVEKPDNTYIFNDYNVCGCAGGLVTDNYDERNNLKTTKKDFLGRLQFARELEPYLQYDNNGQQYIADYTLRAEVEYQYDALDRITQIIHRGGGGPLASTGTGLTGTGQTRSFAYDIWGRAISETTPEAGTVSYTYTTNDQIATTTDANNKITTVAYNNRNLVTGISYNDSTPSVGYTYDDYGARTAMTDGEGAMSYTYNTNRQLESETRTFSGLSGKSYRFQYGYLAGGQLATVNYAALQSTGSAAEPGGADPNPTPGNASGRRGDSRRGTGEQSPTARSEFTNAKIWGYVKRATAYGGQPIAGATVNCQQIASPTNDPSQYVHVNTTTDSYGRYDCENLNYGVENGNSVQYQVTVTAPGWQMTPTSKTVEMWTEQQLQEDFTAAPASATTTISGTVYSPGGLALSGVTITLTGTQNKTATTNSNGQYSITVNTLGNYNLSASRAGYTFTPTTASVGNFVVPQTVNFQAFLGAASPPSLPPGTLFSQTINYAYKTSGALNSIGTDLLGGSSPSNNNVLEAMSYNAFGAATQVSYGNNRRTTLSYNLDLMRMTNLTVARPNGTDKIVENNYNYTNNGLIEWIPNQVDSTYTTSYSYNYRNQMISASRNNTTRYYSYDDWGNWTSAVDYGGYNPTSFTTAKISGTQVPSTNRISSMTVNNGTPTNFTYDNGGNMTAAGSTSYQWDAANRLKSVNNGSLGSYGYDGNGKRVKKTESGTTTYYVYSILLDAALMEVTSSGVQRAYVMNGKSVVAQLNPNGNFYWLHLDHLGSGRKMTDASGNMVYRAEFDPYGKLLYEWSSPTNLNTRKFTGYERDAATNLDYAQARMYGSDWGRFMSPDPMGLRAANPHSPQSLNRYSYTDNNPINRVDPEGKQWIAVGQSCVSSHWSNNGLRYYIKTCSLTFVFVPEPPRPNNIFINPQQAPVSLPIPQTPNWSSLVVLTPPPPTPPPAPSPLNPIQRFFVENGIATAENLLRNADCLRFVSNAIQEAARLQGNGVAVPADGRDPQTGATIYSAVYDALKFFTNQLNAGNISASNAPGGTTYMTTNDGTPQGTLKVKVNNEYFNLSPLERGQHALHESLHQLGITDIYLASAIGVYQSGDDNPAASRRFNERFMQVCR